MNKISSCFNGLYSKYKGIQGKTKKHILIALYAVLFCAFTLLFLAQAKWGYPSDLAAHIEFAKEGRGYSFLYKIMGALCGLIGNEAGVFVLGALIVTATLCLTARFISAQTKSKDLLACSVLALPLIFLSGIAVPFIYPKFYSGHFVAQPYHNFTYFGMRLFALIAMVAFQKIFDRYLTGISVRFWLILSLSLMLSTAIKPSFFYGFALTLLIFLVIDFFKLAIKKELKLAKLGLMILLGVAVFPSLFVILKQILHLYNPAAQAKGNGIELIWGASLLKAGVLGLAVKLVLDLAFPLLVGFSNRKELTRFEKFSVAMFFVQLLVFGLLGETGERATDGNFYWGVYCAGFFMYLPMAARFFRDLLSAKGGEKKRYLPAACVLFAAHCLCSLIYFVIIITGMPYLV